MSKAPKRPMYIRRAERMDRKTDTNNNKEKHMSEAIEALRREFYDKDGYIALLYTDTYNDKRLYHWLYTELLERRLVERDTALLAEREKNRKLEEELELLKDTIKHGVT